MPTIEQSDNALGFVRDQYGVPAEKGRRVAFTFKGRHMGTIIGGLAGKIRVKIDGKAHAELYHPTWEIEYLPDCVPVQLQRYECWTVSAPDLREIYEGETRGKAKQACYFDIDDAGWPVKFTDIRARRI